MKTFLLAIFVIASFIQASYSSDVDILQYALILENLESAFYAKGVQMFSANDFNSAGLSGQYSQFQALAQQEADHVTFITQVLESVNATPNPACTYNFNFKNVNDFVATARALESVGVSAYLGAVNQISNAAYTTAAATITTVEARHQAYLNIISNATGFPEPYDTPLSPAQVVTLATPFFASCPFTLPVKGNNALNITSTGAPNSRIYVNNVITTTGLYCSFLYGSNQTWSKLLRTNRRTYCTAPQNVMGIIYVFITSDNTTPISVTNSSSVKYGPAIFTAVSSMSSQTNNTSSSSSSLGSGSTSSSSSSSGSGSNSMSTSSSSPSSYSINKPGSQYQSTPGQYQYQYNLGPNS